MAFVYENIIIGESLTANPPNASVITTTKGDLVSHNGSLTVRFPVGTDDQFLSADSSTATGLIWKALTPDDVGLIAGNGLVLTGSTLDVVGSATIQSNADNLVVNSSATPNQILLSSGTVGTAATYGALPLGDANSVTGTLPIANGGTGAASFATADRLVATNGLNTALVSTTLDPATIVTLAGTQTLSNKTLVSPVITTSINDANGNQLVGLTPVAASVNEITIGNAATGTSPFISATGDDANIDLDINAKGTGNVTISGIEYPNTDGALNQVLATNGAGALIFVDVPVLDVGTVTTTDATPTTIASLTIPTTTDTAYFVEAKFLARDTGVAGTVASFIVRATFNNDGGTLSTVGTDLVYAPPTITWTATVTTTGTDIIFQVTGAAGTTILWKGVVETITV